MNVWPQTAIALLCATVVAHADEQPPTQKRPVPDYDGRGEQPVRDADIAAAPVRLLLAPLHLAAEVIRRMIGGLAIAAERADLPRKAYDFFLFAPEHKGGVIPVGFMSFGIHPSVGAYAFWNDAFFVPGHDVRLHVEGWPGGWFGATFTERLQFTDNALQLRAVVVQRPDDLFYGFGPNSLQSNQSRYREHRIDATLGFEQGLWRGSRIVIDGGVRRMRVGAGDYGNDPSVDEKATMGAFELPYGFGRSYFGPTGRIYGAFDARESPHSSGVRLEAQASGGSDVTQMPRAAWVRYGAVATGTVDLDGHDRIVELSVAGLFADPLTASPMPFTELVTLGGKTWMSGFMSGRLVDRSAAVAEIHYRWPLAPLVDAVVQTSVGNVFGAHLDGFDVGSLRLSSGIGLGTRSSPPFEVIVGAFPRAITSFGSFAVSAAFGSGPLRLPP